MTATGKSDSGYLPHEQWGAAPLLHCIVGRLGPPRDTYWVKDDHAVLRDAGPPDGTDALEQSRSHTQRTLELRKEPVVLSAGGVASVQNRLAIGDENQPMARFPNRRENRVARGHVAAAVPLEGLCLGECG